MSAQLGDTAYHHGDEVQSGEVLNCPERCEIPADLKLVQLVTPGTAFSLRCPNGCGMALRWVTR